MSVVEEEVTALSVSLPLPSLVDGETEKVEDDAGRRGANERSSTGR
jgi:hypothetical protein